MPWTTPNFQKLNELKVALVSLMEAVIKEEQRKLLNLQKLQDNLKIQKEM